jgi:predicted NodU family carbamoyl transferase
MDQAIARIIEIIDKKGFVNVVYTDMEFGPRALCHTSTIALPDLEISAYINKINARTNEMPFAPVMTQAQANVYLQDQDRVFKSLGYMICTRDVQPPMVEFIRGACHKYPNSNVYTARPQIVNDGHFMYRVLKAFDRPLINTSYNYHGVPIVFTSSQIMHTHAMQTARADIGLEPTTVVIGD